MYIRSELNQSLALPRPVPCSGAPSLSLFFGAASYCVSEGKEERETGVKKTEKTKHMSYRSEKAYRSFCPLYTEFN